MHPQLQEIEKASEGLYYISETDAPFHLIETAEYADPKQAAFKLSGNDENEPVEEVTLEHFFRNTVKNYPDATPEQQQMVQRFIQLQTTLLQNLKDVKVYRIGSIQIKVYILGKLPDGTYAGLSTQLVET